MKKILVAMSGGVDSSVTGYLLKEQGYECCGCTMKLYESEELDRCSCTNDGATKTCCSADDVEDARSVAYNLGMPFYVLNYKEDFEKCVIADFVKCYECGMTPNPCIQCNKHMKFEKLLKQAEALGYEGVATGHYARIEEENGVFRLKKASDPSKDQSYVLYNLSQEQLSKIKFPLGGLPKSEVREIAEKQGFINARKHDSQDICFVPGGDYASMIERYTGKTFKPGNFVDVNGNVIGPHKGIIHYTIGQRRGLGIPAKDRLYVIKLDVEKNEVVLGSNEDLFSKTVKVSDLNWIEGSDIPTDFRCSAKIRYRMNEQPCSVHYEGDGHATITFDEAQRAATPGQSAVLYDGDTVLGGGIIF